MIQVRVIHVPNKFFVLSAEKYERKETSAVTSKKLPSLWLQTEVVFIYQILLRPNLNNLFRIK